ncbi:transposase [Desulfovibrio psychrotolerans]|uniref:Transposase n=1 Tax=Desulfovibrio psychrotolerans TaxID=415242 RepID=A0A7J0BXX1_9BACT|nr:transposase [Desulfovibrio psychrotolerans]
MSNTRRIYDAEFKRNAVMLAEEPGRTVADVAESLGIGPDLIYRWGREMRGQGLIAFPGHGKPALTDEQRRIKELEKKLRDAEIERDILKKALAIFSKAPN